MMVTNRLLILASVESIRDRHYAYSSCGQCYSKVLFDSDTANWVCIKCRSNRLNVVRRYRMNFRITDNTRLANVTVFGTNLDKFFGCTADAFYQSLESFSRTCPQLINETLVDSAIEDTFVGNSFLFGFKLPHAKHQHCTWNAGNVPSLEMILPNVDGNSFAGGLQNAEASNSVAWQMLFACDDQRFTTVLARLRGIVDDFGSSPRLNAGVNESSLFALSGYETSPSLSCTSSVESKRISSVDETELSLVLSCDQDVVGYNVETKDFTDRASGYSSLDHLPGSLAGNFLTNATNNNLIQSNVPIAHLEAGTNTHFDNIRLFQHGSSVCDVSKQTCDSGFCSNALTTEFETLPKKLSKVLREKSNGGPKDLENKPNDLNLDEEPGPLNPGLDRKIPQVAFDKSSFDEIEICRMASVIFQERHDFSSEKCRASAVSQEVTKKRNSQNSPLFQLNTTSTRPQSCTLDLVEAPYSEDLDAFLAACEKNERPTGELPADSNTDVVCHLDSIPRDSCSENWKDWEQPYSEDLDEFLKGCNNNNNNNKSVEKQFHVHLKPVSGSSLLQQMSNEESFASDTVVSKPADICGNGLRVFTESGCDDELFSFWSDDFEQQVAHSSISGSVDNLTRQYSSQQLVAEQLAFPESPKAHSSSVCMRNHAKKILINNSLQQSSSQFPLEHFSVARSGEVYRIASLDESKENAESRDKLCCASDIVDSTSSLVSGHSRQEMRKSTRKTTSCTAALSFKKTPRLSSHCKMPVDTSSSCIRSNACDSFSSKSLQENSPKDCASHKRIALVKHSTRKTGHRSVATPVDQSFDLFQSPCYTHTGLSHRHSRSRTHFPSTTKFQFSSTPLSTVRTCRLKSLNTHNSHTVTDDISRRLAGSNDSAGNICTQLTETYSPDYIVSTVVPASPSDCRLNPHRDRTSSLALSRLSTSLISSNSPELFENSLQLHRHMQSPGRAGHSWIGGTHKEIPPCNLFNSSSQNVSGNCARDSISGLPVDQSEDMFGYSGDLFVD